MKKRSSVSNTRKILLTVTALVFILSIGVYLVITVFLPMREKQKQKALAETLYAYPVGGENESAAISTGEREDVILAKYLPLYEQNPDLRGWIRVPEYGIDLPVVQGPDNDYYLRRSFTGEWSLAGTPFFDCRIEDFHTLPRNTVVYGHNMRRNDIMFGVFQNLRTVEGYQACPVIEVDTLYREYRWFVYAVFVTNPYEYQDNGYFFPYNFININDASFSEYVKEIDKRKLYATGVELTPEDKLLTISTCCYDFRYARLVVVARLQREGEPDVPDISLAEATPSPKYPQAWYDAMHLKNPYAADPRWLPD